MLLGDTSLGAGMTAVPASVWTNADVRLRVWFNDGTTGFQLLSPDQRLAPNGYLPDGSVSTAAIAANAVTSAKIAAGAVNSSQLAPGASSPPVTVPGASQAAVANTSYVATGAGQTEFTLPSTANLGDTVQISGAGAGGWTVSSFIPRETVRNWRAVASSSDGGKLVAAEDGGLIYTSTDFGVNWTPRASSQNWYSVASSDDGTKLVAVALQGQIYTSPNSGANWIPRASNRNWSSVASSADGTKLVATVVNGQIYTSTDSGVTWTPRESNRQWLGVASSTDGVKLVAVGNTQIYTSTDSGASWTARESVRSWQSVASSADGTKLVAINYLGRIYTSTDSGANWTPRESNREWNRVASSADGSKLVAVVSGGQIFTSTDSGGSWTPKEANRFWNSVASSSDGSRLVAVAGSDTIYTSSAVTVGGQGTHATMQYFGNGRWEPVGEYHGSVGTNQLASGAVGSNQIADLSITTADLANGSITASKLDSSIGGLWSVNGGDFYRANGNVGIGTSTPGAPLDVRVPTGGTGALCAQFAGRVKIFDESATIGPKIHFAAGFGGQITADGPIVLVPSGNVGIGTTTPGSKLDVSGEVTCVAVNITSDRNAKEQFKPVNARDVLEKVARLPISEWQYKTAGDARHIGPMAQDFRDAFALGRDEKHITSVDADGVALAAIQGLNEKVVEKDAELARLKAENHSLAERLAAIERALGLPEGTTRSAK